MSMISVPNIDNELKQDFFNCYKFENSSKINNPQFPKSIIGTRNYNESIEQFWEKYKIYITNKYYDFQIIAFSMNYNDLDPLNDKFSVMFKLIDPKNSMTVYILSYYNANNINLEFYEQFETIFGQENWKVEKFIDFEVCDLCILPINYNTLFKIELYKSFNEDDLDARLSIKQILSIASKYISRFYHESTNNGRHYAEEFFKIYKEYKDQLLQKENLY